MEARQLLTRRFFNPRIAGYGMLFTVLIALGAYVFAAYEREILQWMQDNQEWLRADMRQHPVFGAVVFTLVFALVLGLFIPGGVVLMLMVGAIFPFWQANIIANIGNLIGATIGFLISRYLLHDEVQTCYGDRLHRINKGIQANGWLYLIILRIAPVVPSPVVNLSMGLTPMTVRTYMVATLVGRIPMTTLYVYLGAELGQISRMSELVSLEIIGSIFLVCLLLLAGHFALQRYEKGT